MKITLIILSLLFSLHAMGNSGLYFEKDGKLIACTLEEAGSGLSSTGECKVEKFVDTEKFCFKGSRERIIEAINHKQIFEFNDRTVIISNALYEGRTEISFEAVDFENEYVKEHSSIKECVSESSVREDFNSAFQSFL